MKLSQTIFFLLTLITSIHALALPTSFNALTEASKDLFKRKGGGGKGGGTSSGTSGSTGSTSGSTGSTGSTSGSTSSSGGRTGSSSSGGSVSPSYGSRGSAYSGGSTTPYKTGARSAGGIAPYVLGAGALALFPGLWLYGAYAYNWPHTYTYYNGSANMNETHPVSCYCGTNADCGCDENTDQTYLNSVANDTSLSHLADVNGTQTLLINGTLPEDTVVTQQGAATTLGQTSGLWIVAAGVGYTMWFM